jgi:hypothetical protein
MACPLSLSLSLPYLYLSLSLLSLDLSLSGPGEFPFSAPLPLDVIYPTCLPHPSDASGHMYNTMHVFYKSSSMICHHVYVYKCIHVHPLRVTLTLTLFVCETGPRSTRLTRKLAPHKLRNITIDAHHKTRVNAMRRLHFPHCCLLPTSIAWTSRLFWSVRMSAPGISGIRAARSSGWTDASNSGPTCAARTGIYGMALSPPPPAAA